MAAKLRGMGNQKVACSPHGIASWCTGGWMIELLKGRSDEGQAAWLPLRELKGVTVGGRTVSDI